MAAAPGALAAGRGGRGRGLPPGGAAPPAAPPVAAPGGPPAAPMLRPPPAVPPGTPNLRNITPANIGKAAQIMINSMQGLWIPTPEPLDAADDLTSITGHPSAEQYKYLTPTLRDWNSQVNLSQILQTCEITPGNEKIAEIAQELIEKISEDKKSDIKIQENVYGVNLLRIARYCWNYGLLTDEVQLPSERIEELNPQPGAGGLLTERTLVSQVVNKITNTYTRNYYKLFYKNEEIKRMRAVIYLGYPQISESDPKDPSFFNKIPDEEKMQILRNLYQVLAQDPLGKIQPKFSNAPKFFSEGNLLMHIIYQMYRKENPSFPPPNGQRFIQYYDQTNLDENQNITASMKDKVGIVAAMAALTLMAATNTEPPTQANLLNNRINVITQLASAANEKTSLLARREPEPGDLNTADLADRQLVTNSLDPATPYIIAQLNHLQPLGAPAVPINPYSIYGEFVAPARPPHVHGVAYRSQLHWPLVKKKAYKAEKIIDFFSLVMTSTKAAFDKTEENDINSEVKRNPDNEHNLIDFNLDLGDLLAVFNFITDPVKITEYQRQINNEDENKVTKLILTAMNSVSKDIDYYIFYRDTVKPLIDDIKLHANPAKTALEAIAKKTTSLVELINQIGRIPGLDDIDILLYENATPRSFDYVSFFVSNIYNYHDQITDEIPPIENESEITDTDFNTTLSPKYNVIKEALDYSKKINDMLTQTKNEYTKIQRSANIIDHHCGQILASLTQYHVNLEDIKTRSNDYVDDFTTAGHNQDITAILDLFRDANFNALGDINTLKQVILENNDNLKETHGTNAQDIIDFFETIDSAEARQSITQITTDNPLFRDDTNNSPNKLAMLISLFNIDIFNPYFKEDVNERMLENMHDRCVAEYAALGGALHIVQRFAGGDNLLVKYKQLLNAIKQLILEATRAAPFNGLANQDIQTILDSVNEKSDSIEQHTPIVIAETELAEATAAVAAPGAGGAEQNRLRDATAALTAVQQATQENDQTILTEYTEILQLFFKLLYQFSAENANHWEAPFLELFNKIKLLMFALLGFKMKYDFDNLNEKDIAKVFSYVFHDYGIDTDQKIELVENLLKSYKVLYKIFYVGEDKLQNTVIPNNITPTRNEIANAIHTLDADAAIQHIITDNAAIQTHETPNANKFENLKKSVNKSKRTCKYINDNDLMVADPLKTIASASAAIISTSEYIAEAARYDPIRKVFFNDRETTQAQSTATFAAARALLGANAVALTAAAAGGGANITATAPAPFVIEHNLHIKNELCLVTGLSTILCCLGNLDRAKYLSAINASINVYFDFGVGGLPDNEAVRPPLFSGYFDKILGDPAAPPPPVDTLYLKSLIKSPDKKGIKILKLPYNHPTIKKAFPPDRLDHTKLITNIFAKITNPLKTYLENLINYNVIFPNLFGDEKQNILETLPDTEKIHNIAEIDRKLRTISDETKLLLIKDFIKCDSPPGFTPKSNEYQFLDNENHELIEAIEKYLAQNGMQQLEKDDFLDYTKIYSKFNMITNPKYYPTKTIKDLITTKLDSLITRYQSIFDDITNFKLEEYIKDGEIKENITRYLKFLGVRELIEIQALKTQLARLIQIAEIKFDPLKTYLGGIIAIFVVLKTELDSFFEKTINTEIKFSDIEKSKLAKLTHIKDDVNKFRDYIKKYSDILYYETIILNCDRLTPDQKVKFQNRMDNQITAAQKTEITDSLTTIKNTIEQVFSKTTIDFDYPTISFEIFTTYNVDEVHKQMKAIHDAINDGDQSKIREKIDELVLGTKSDPPQTLIEDLYKIKATELTITSENKIAKSKIAQEIKASQIPHYIWHTEKYYLICFNYQQEYYVTLKLEPLTNQYRILNESDFHTEVESKSSEKIKTEFIAPSINQTVNVVYFNRIKRGTTYQHFNINKIYEMTNEEYRSSGSASALIEKSTILFIKLTKPDKIALKQYFSKSNTARRLFPQNY